MAVVIWTSGKSESLLTRVAEKVFPITHTDNRTELSVEQQPTVLPQIEKGDVLVAMGGPCLNLLKEYGAVPKNRTIGSLRQKMHEYPPGKLLLSYDPSIVEIDTGREPEIIYDLQLACRLHDLGTLIPKVGKYKYVNDFDKVLKQIKKAHKRTGNPVAVSGDLETIGFDPFYKSDIPRPPDLRVVCPAELSTMHTER